MKFLEIYTYRFYILAACSALVLSLAGWLGHNYYENFQNKKAEAEVYPYRDRLVQAEKKAGGEIYEANSSFFALKKAQDESAFSKDLEDYKNFLLSKNSYRMAHWIASIELAYFLIQYNQEKQALSLLENVSLKSSSKGWVYHMMLYQLGVLFMNQKNYTRALFFFSKVVSNKNSLPFREEAFLKMALCYEEMGELDKAQQIYTELGKDNSRGFYKERVRHYDRLIQVKKKIGGLL